MLAEALCSHPDLPVRNLAARTLELLDSPAAVDALCARWAATRNAGLERIVTRNRHVARHPLSLQVLTAVKTGRYADLAALSEIVVDPLLAACRDRDPAVAAGARDALGALTDPRATDAFCRHLMSGADPDLVPIAVSRKLAPREPSERALFYFMTEQWRAYEVLDYREDRPLLRRGYARAAEAVRTAFLAVARRSGRSSLVSSALATGGRRLKAREMDRAEWESIAEGLTRDARWDELWRLCFLAPVNVACQIVRTLNATPWCPPPHENDVWEELERLCPEEGLRLTLAPGAHLRTIGGLADSVDVLYPAGTLLAGAVRNMVKLWPQDPNDAAVLQGHRAAVTALCVAPEGRILASAGKDRTVRLWSLPGGKLVKTLQGHRDWVSCLDIVPDGTILASGSKDSTVRLWSLPGGRALRTLSHVPRRTDASWVLCLRATPDGSLLVTGSKDSSVRLWQLPHGEHVRTLEGHRDGVLCLAMRPDGRVLASGGKEGSIQLWRLPDGDRLAAFDAHAGGVLSLAASPDGTTLASGGHDGTVRLWRFPDGAPLETLEGHTGGVLHLVVADSRGSVMASASSDCTVRIWSLIDRRPLAVLRGHDAQVRSLCVGPDGATLASGGADKTVRLWQLTWDKPIALADHDDLARVMELAGNENLAERERNRWRFLEAILRARFRYDISLEEGVVAISPYDIEIEIDDR
jgi:hypothetical protein